MNVSLQNLEIIDSKNNLSFSCKVLYPSLDIPENISFGPYTLDVAPDGQMAGGQFPLVLISHGNGGTALVYRNMALHLARCGFVVAMPEHYGNNRADNSLAESVDNLIYRPYHLHLVIEAICCHNFFKKNILNDKMVVVGHSFGGYSALALAGGVPSTREGVQLDVQHDDRIKAIVLLAPAAGWFYPQESLKAVHIPISLWMGEKDHITPRQWSSDIVINGIPNPSLVEFHEVSGAGHFSFLAPFPAAMQNPAFPPSTDPEGFDRAKFHETFPSAIEGFLRRVLAV